ncbi:MAG TPA: lipopolysaccharide transport periplasmic protein LptA [Azoarcus sp.]|nr:lipopolysaccharide transport periplasmic protein LptA [Azoarcus sp.]
MTRPFISLLLTGLLILSAPSVFAQSNNASDRDQPINITSDKATVDDRNNTHTFEGNVLLTQGSLELRGDKLVVIQGPDGFHTGVVTVAPGKLATFRQKREGTNEYIEGEAERIEYDARTEVATLFVRAEVISGGDVVRGDIIEYDALTENYSAHRLPDSSGPQTHVTIQPRNSGAE